jgi:hypothetical protein
MPEGQTYNWGNTLGTIATMATGNPYIGMAVNHGFNWTRQDKGNNDNSGSYNTGKLANNVVTAYAASKSAKKRAQATQNAGKLDLGYLRAEAERNGFNPLTVLRATGGQGSRTSPDVGKMASAQFWQTFAQGLPNTYDYNDKQIERGRDDIPTTVVAYDPTGTMPDFRVVNPELIESSANEAASSAAMIATQYVAQHGGDYQTVLATIQNINQTRQKNQQDPIRLKNNKISKSIYEQITNIIGNSLDAKLQSFEKVIGYDRNEKILVTPILQQQRVMEQFP